MRAVVVVKNGRIVGERYGEGFSAETPLLGWSMTKSVNGGDHRHVGQVRQAGRRPTSGCSRAWKADGRAAISVADLMAMSSGLEFNEDYGDVTDVTRMLYLEPDMAGFAAAKPLADTVGSVFNYSSGTTLMLSRLWQDAAGAEALSCPRQALFDPIGMTSAVLETGCARHLRRLVLPLRDGARLGAVRPVPAAGRRLERPGNPAAGLCRLDARGGAGLEGAVRQGPGLAARAGRRHAGRAGSRRRLRPARGHLLARRP